MARGWEHRAAVAPQCSAVHGPKLADAGDSSRRQQQGNANGSSSFGQHPLPSDMNQPSPFSYQ